MKPALQERLDRMALDFLEIKVSKALEIARLGASPAAMKKISQIVLALPTANLFAKELAEFRLNKSLTLDEIDVLVHIALRQSAEGQRQDLIEQALRIKAVHPQRMLSPKDVEHFVEAAILNGTDAFQMIEQLTHSETAPSQTLTRPQLRQYLDSLEDRKCVNDEIFNVMILLGSHEPAVMASARRICRTTPVAYTDSWEETVSETMRFLRFTGQETIDWFIDECIKGCWISGALQASRIRGRFGLRPDQIERAWHQLREHNYLATHDAIALLNQHPNKEKFEECIAACLASKWTEGAMKAAKLRPSRILTDEEVMGILDTIPVKE